MPDFAQATILITGASSGIGAATARLLAERGAKLILVALDDTGFDAFPDARTIVGDIADEALWARADLSGLTHAVLNAGIARGGRIEDLTFADWRAVMATNLDGTFLTLRAAMRALKGKGGAVVITASASGIKAEPGNAPYAASKAALIHLAKVAAREGAPDGVRVNAIAPAGVETAMWDAQPFFREMAEAQGGPAQAYQALAATTPLGRFAKGEEIAAQIAFLLSDAAATITGATLVSDGGYTL